MPILFLIAALALHVRVLSALAVPPTITGFSPASAPVPTEVTITGTGFTGATTVTINGLRTGFKAVSATQILATIPKGATSGPISVTGPGGTATSTAPFTVVLPPTLTGFSPRSGFPGVTVTITGTNFTGATAVKFNGLGTTFQLSSATQITAPAPSGVTAGPISVTNAAGTATSTTNFTLCCLPMVTLVSPNPAVPGAQIVIMGAGFTGVTGVAFKDAPCQRFTVSSDVQIIAILPAGVTGSAPVTVTNPVGTVSSAFITVNPSQ